MNSRSDLRMPFEAQPRLQSVSIEPTRRTWLPAYAAVEGTSAPTHWVTRASRGFSWHRAGRANARDAVR